MVAELCKDFSPFDFINTELCFLDYRYEELGAVFNSRPLRKIIENSGSEGAAFLNGLESFLETQDKDGLYESTDVSGEENLRPLFTYKLTSRTINKIHIYLEGLLMAASKQKYNA